MTQSIRFAHLADLHLGAWRERFLTQLNFKTFQEAIQKVIDENLDFCLFAGDIFNNAIPPLDLVNDVVKELMKLKNAGIPLYVIGGSHDYSNSGKSFIHLLENAGVFVDVGKFEEIEKGKVKLNVTEDERTQTRLSGILGKKKGLDKNIYEKLSQETLSNEVLNIFLFHTTLDDFKPDFMKAVEAGVEKNYLPSGFDYYAGGHVHTHMQGSYSTGLLSYPGPLFPNNFSEMKREVPSFNLCTFDKETRKLEIERVFVETYEKEVLVFDFDKLTPHEIKTKIEKELEQRELKQKILLLELSGIVDGKVSEVKIQELVNYAYELGALQVLKNTYKLTSAELEKASFSIDLESQNLEEELVKEFLKEKNASEIEALVSSLLSLELIKQEGEKNAQYEERVVEALEKALNVIKS